MAEATAAQEIPPNLTLYIKNLNEKIKVDRLKKSLHAVFAQFGNILDIMAFKTLKHKGQAWVVFEDFDSATKALRQMQGFPFYDEPMKIQYAKTKSDIISKADGTYVPREKRKKQGEKGGKKRKEQHDPNLTGVAMNNPAYVSGHRASTSLSQLQYPSERPIVPEAPAAPNNVLFIQNLPHGTISSLLQSLFNHYPGLKEVRMVETKPGIAFVEYEDEVQSTAAMLGLQGLKIEANTVVITYANR